MVQYPELSGPLLALLLIAGGDRACAHDFWINRDSNGSTLVQGHLLSRHKGEARVEYDPAIVKRAWCVNTEGESKIVQPVLSYPARVPGQCSATLFELSSGYWTQTLTETVQKRRSEVRNALRGWISEESIKRLDTWTPSSAQPIGNGLELVPLSNPLGLAPGAKLAVLVTWQGRPRPGVAVAYEGDVRGTTGADGRINIRIRRGGTQMLSASVEEPIGDENADKVVRSTALQFDLPK